MICWEKFLTISASENDIINHNDRYILIIKTVRYNVIPIGINTTIPAIKLFLILAKVDHGKNTFCNEVHNVSGI